MYQLNYSHCLRQNFTRDFVDTHVNNQDSLNILGGYGAGKTRFVQDIKQLELLDTQVADVDMRNYLQDYQGLVHDLNKQLRISAGKPNMSATVSKIVQNKTQRYLIVFDDMDTLFKLKRHDQRYDADFLSGMDDLRKSEHVSLVCMGVNSIKDLYNDQLACSLYMKEKHMEKLTREEIREELDREIPNHKIFIDNNKYFVQSLIIEKVYQHKQSYSLLVHLIKNLKRTANSDLSGFHNILHYWVSDFR